MESLQKVLGAIHTTTPSSPQLDSYNRGYYSNGKPTFDETAPPSVRALQYLSMKDSSSVEDETDWDGVSSPDSDTERMSLQMEFIKIKEEQDLLLYQQLTGVQLSLVHRLMKEFWVIFNDRWQSESTQHGSTQSGSSTGSSSSIFDAQGFAESNASSSKRPRHSENGDSDSDKSRPSKRKGKEPQRPDPCKIMLRFACPFRKRNPRKYCVQTWRACALTPHTTVARVK